MADTSRPRITRNRELRSCVECRRRKLRCDRHLPCTSCIRRNDPSSCVYERRDRPEENERRLHAEARLVHLEQLVQQLSQQASDNDRSSNSGAYAIVDDGDQHDGESHIPSQPQHKNLYHSNSSTHWSAMLEDIDELRSSLAASDGPEAPEMFGNDSTDGASLLFGAARPLPYQEILVKFLPPKRESDRLVATYFRTKAITAPFIHAEQFSRLYQLFWDDPLLAPPLWTSILFTILDISSKTLSSTAADLRDDQRQRTKDEDFSLAAAHCLAAGKYYTARRFAVEALLLYAQRMCFASFDMPSELAIIFGTLIRLATSLGYHREPDNYENNLSTFEREMRRRTWSLCMQLELLVSFQLGLPSTIQGPIWDTNLPSNLLDSDIHEDTLDMPTGVNSEPSTLLFYIAKHKLMAVFEKIIRLTSNPSSSTIDQLEAIDQELRTTRESLPAYLHTRPIATSIADSPSVIVTRLCVDQIYHKCLCVLHRRYVTRGRSESVHACYDSASNLVRLFLDVYEEFGPGGQLETEKWFMSSITWHDFLLGCMALCLVLCSIRVTSVDSSCVIDGVNLSESLTLLQNAKAVCEEQTGRSRDSQRVRRLLEATILLFDSEDTVSSSLTLNLPNDSQSMAYHNAIYTQGASHNWSNETWAQTNSPAAPVDEEEWTFLRQFLNLPNDELPDAQ